MNKYIKIASIFILSIIIISCSDSKKDLPSITDGKVINSQDIRNDISNSLKISYSLPILSTQNYLEVNSLALPSLIDAYRDELFRLGIPVSDVTGQSGWDNKFNCTDFTDLFLGFSGAKVETQLWNSWSVGQKPAIFALWYFPDNRKDLKEGHSIVMIITEKGIIFVDPQLKEPVILSSTEIASIYHLRS